MFPQIKEESEIGGFEIIKEINRGSFSSVYKCRNKSNCTKGLEEKKLYALKIFTVEDEYKYIPDAELKLLSDLGAHKNVSKIFAIVNLRNNLREKFRAAIMPLALFDLSDMINECGKLPADHGNNAFLQVCSGLDHLHKKEIAHGDVKPNNILVYVEDSDLCYKLTDFDGFQADGFDNEVHTTKEYSPPEFVLAEKYTLKSDIWSLACTFIELRTGICLFDDDQDYSDDDESSICDDEEHPGSFVYNKLKDLLRINTREESKEESKEEPKEEPKEPKEESKEELKEEDEENEDGSSCRFSRESDSDSDDDVLTYEEVRLVKKFVYFLGPFPRNISINFPTLLTRKGFMINQEKDGSKENLLDFLVQELGAFDARQIFHIVVPMLDYSEENRPTVKKLLDDTKFTSYVDEVIKETKEH